MYQQVYDSTTKAVRPLHPVPDGLGASGLGHAGRALPPAKAVALAEGRLNSTTLELFPISPADGREKDPDAVDDGDGESVDSVIIVRVNVERYISNAPRVAPLPPGSTLTNKDPASWNHKANPARNQKFNETETKQDTMAPRYYGNAAVKRNCRDGTGGGAAYVLGTPAGHIAVGAIRPGSNGEALEFDALISGRQAPAHP